MHRFVLRNGGIHESSARLLSPGQIGLLSGWGVFSTLRVAEGVPFAFERHFERMRRDAAVLHVPFPDGPEEMLAGVGRLIEANQAFHATLRVAVVRNQGGIWEGPSERAFDTIALTTGLKHWGEGVKLALAEQARHAGSRFRGVKMLSWALNLTLLEEAQDRGFDEALLLNERGEVSECTSANLFAAFGSEVRTPPLESGCLPGVTRELLFETAASLGVLLRETTLFPEDLFSADEVFITSTTRNLLPVTSIEGRPLRAAGDIRQRLETAFEAYVLRYVSEHRPAPAAHDRPPSAGRNPAYEPNERAL
jgi:branched-chain amino acid aminotransferase